MAHVLHRSIPWVLALCCVTVAGAALAAEDAQMTPDRPGQHRYTNRLVDSADPYLLLHAHNPVDWYPWGPEALARAKKENKPIFLSVGYSTCYWCHVAEKTLYSRPEIAALMNPWFINIKVDREQLPDIDRIYMLATELMTGHGGWPNNVFLTPDLKPFYAGSYFGPTDGDRGRPGFPTVLKKIRALWTTDEPQVRAVAERTFQAMQQIQTRLAGGRAVPLAPREWLASARQALVRQFDATHGGFSGGGYTKFPREPVLDLLLADYRVNRSADSLRMLEQTLVVMASGGVYDQLASGFHRYSTEPTWSVPHFEKMLYNNAQLLAIYVQAYDITRNALYRLVAVDLSEYLAREMLAPEGGFYSAQDAEVNGEEGASYVWTREETTAVLGAEGAKRFFQVYDLTPLARQHAESLEQPGVLRVRSELMQKSGDEVVRLLTAVAPLRARLLETRNRRPQPLRDDKIVVGVNGLAIDAYVRSARILRRDRDLEAAKRTAERLWTVAYDPKSSRLKHEIFRGRAQTEAYLDDYALLGRSFMSLYEATKEAMWRQRAIALAEAIVRHFLRDNGRLSTSPNEKELLIMPQDQGDDVHGSGTSATVDLLLRVAAASRDPRYAAFADRILRYVGGGVQERPETWGMLVAAVNLNKAAGSVQATARSGAAARGPGIPGTADHVRVTATTMATGDHDEIVTTLKIDEGWHVNANPASFDHLIPTSVSFEGLSAARVVYPLAVRINPKFAPDGLDVYEGLTKVITLFPKGTLAGVGNVRGTVTVQACSHEVCLLPAKIPVVAK
jgi:uncharacterized protein YyaL (SSP411 family)